MPDVTFIIVSWNAKRFLLECLRSIYQTVKDVHFAVVVVDNASTDGSPEAVEEEYPDVKLIKTSLNLGFAKANNIGMASAHSPFFCLVNSDVRLHEGCLDSLHRYMIENPKVGIVGPKVLNMDGTLQTTCKYFPRLGRSFLHALGLHRSFSSWRYLSENYLLGRIEEEPRVVEVVTGCFWMVRRDAVHEVGGLDERFFMYGEDKDWCRRFWASKWKVVYFPKAEATHYGGASSDNAPLELFLEMQKANLQYWRKHHGVVLQFGYMVTMMLHQLVRIAIRFPVFLASTVNRRESLFKIRRSLSCIRHLLTGRLLCQHEGFLPR